MLRSSVADGTGLSGRKRPKLYKARHNDWRGGPGLGPMLTPVESTGGGAAARSGRVRAILCRAMDNFRSQVEGRAWVCVRDYMSKVVATSRMSEGSIAALRLRTSDRGCPVWAELHLCSHTSDRPIGLPGRFRPTCTCGRTWSQAHAPSGQDCICARTNVGGAAQRDAARPAPARPNATRPGMHKCGRRGPTRRDAARPTAAPRGASGAVPERRRLPSSNDRPAPPGLSRYPWLAPGR
jgi:hypothetical protein